VASRPFFIGTQMPTKSKFRILYEKVLNRLPSSYPKPKLIIHSSMKKLKYSYWETNTYDKDFESPPVAWCGIVDNTIHVALTNLKTEDIGNILFNYLHEIGHLYAFNKYGFNDPRWLDDKVSEKYADDFAARWSKKLLKEKFQC
jgi:Zn-dependent peptidase ImmA (M78 family)